MCLSLLVFSEATPVFASALPEQAPAESAAGLSATTFVLAQNLGLVPIIEKLQEYKQRPPADLAGELDRQRLSRALVSKVLIASLEVRDVTARIEREIVLIDRMRGVLEDRRDRAIKLNSIENIVASGGLSEIASANAFMVNQIPGNSINVVASALTMGLGAWALRQQTGGKHRVVLKPNMLAPVFNYKGDQESTYPDSVWTYLNSTVPGSSQTRREGLLDRWRKFKVIPTETKSPAGRKRLGVLTNTDHSGTCTIGDFEDQTEMLAELKAEIFQLDRDLLDLLKRTQEISQ